MKWKRFAKYEHNWFYFSSSWMMIWCWFNLSNANFIQYNFLHHFTSNIYDLSSFHCFFRSRHIWRSKRPDDWMIYLRWMFISSGKLRSGIQFWKPNSNFLFLLSMTVSVYQTSPATWFTVKVFTALRCSGSTMPHHHVSLFSSRSLSTRRRVSMRR